MTTTEAKPTRCPDCAKPVYVAKDSTGRTLVIDAAADYADHSCPPIQ